MPTQKNIILIGFSSTGKSTVGKKLAARFGFDFIDLDTVIEALFRAETHNALRCRDIVRLFGHDTFQRLETAGLRQLAERSRTIIATGGGAVLPEENRPLIEALGMVVYLAATPEAILQRMHRKGAPVFMRGVDGTPDIPAFMAQRDPIYREIADLVIDTSDLNPDSSALRIAALIENPES